MVISRFPSAPVARATLQPPTAIAALADEAAPYVESMTSPEDHDASFSKTSGVQRSGLTSGEKGSKRIARNGRSGGGISLNGPTKSSSVREGKSSIVLRPGSR